MKTSSVSAPDISFSYTEDFTQSDKTNVIAVYSALKGIPLSAAADERFWAAFCHTYGWRFIQHRRAADIETNNSKRLKTLFFFSAGTRRSCYLNALAKYWWCGHMIYDAEGPDPYAALDVICGLSYFSSLVLFMASSNFTSNKNVVLGIIDSFRKLKSQGIEIKTDYWKRLLIYLNKLGAVMILDALSRTDITEICDRQLQKILQKNPLPTT